MKLPLAFAGALLAVAVSSCATQSDTRAAAPSGQAHSAGMATMDDQRMAQLQERMKQMQEQMDRIRQARDPQERQKLMQEHMQTMNESMSMMRGMSGGMMMGMMGDKHMNGGSMPGMDPKHSQQMMNMCMDMMQMMMEQMQQHQQMMQSMPPGR